MTEHEVKLYAKASLIARVALGRDKWGHGRGTTRYWIADEDPLAWWCLTERIAELAKDYAAGSYEQNGDSDAANQG